MRCTKWQIGCTCTATAILAIGIALIAVGAVVMQVILPNTIHSQVEKNKVIGKLDDGSYNDITRSWMNPNYQTYMQYWIFNYTNTLGILHRGSFPDVIEKGPYSYREIQKNEIEAWSDDHSQLYYRPKSIYIFDKKTSCPTCDPKDVFLVPDILFFKIMSLLSDPKQIHELLCSLPLGSLLCRIDLSQIQQVLDNYTDSIAVAMKALDAGPFVYTSVEDLIFNGYDDPIFSKVIDLAIKVIKRLIPGIANLIPEITQPKVNLNSKNNTSGYRYTILTGKDNSETVGQILSFFDSENGTSNSDGNLLPETWWSNPNSSMCEPQMNILARKINGTLGDFFKPFIENSDTIYLFVPDVCRSLRFTYKEEVTVKGIDGKRFTIPDEVFDYSIKENCGFCHELHADMYSKKEGDLCLPNGLLDISRCTALNPPIVASNPHFFGAAKEVLQLFPRLHPSPDIHQTTVDIEPTMGILLKANKRLQINLIANRIKNAPTYEVLLPGVYPIVWINESFLIDDGTVSDLNSQLISPRRTVKTVCWVVGIGLGIFCVLLSVAQFLCAVFCARKLRRERKNGESCSQSCSSTVISTEETSARHRAVRKMIS